MKYDIEGRYDCSKIDEETIKRLQRFDDEVMPIYRVEQLVDKVCYVIDEKIKLIQDYIGPREVVWGNVFDKLIADNINEYLYVDSNLSFGRGEDHNVDRDVKCNVDSFDIEVKTALKNPSGGYNSFCNAVCQNETASRKYKSKDEKNYYILVQLERSSDIVTKANHIWFGRLSENDWEKRWLTNTVRDNNCIQLR